MLSLLAVAQERHHKHDEDEASGDAHHDLLDEQRRQLTQRGSNLLVRIWHTQVPLMQYGRGRSPFPLQINAEYSGHTKDVFVTASRQVDQDNLVGRHGWCDAHHVCDGVCTLKRWDNAFEFAEGLEGIERFFVVHRDVLDASLVVKHGVFGADGGVVEARRYTVRE